MTEFKPTEIWLLKATPTDPARRPFLLGEGCLVAFSREQADRYVSQSDPRPGVASLEPVRVHLT